MRTISKTGWLLRIPRAGRSFGITFRAALYAAVQHVLHWLELTRGRRHLARLDDRLLRDIGLSRADIEPEIAKPFWRD